VSRPFSSCIAIKVFHQPNDFLTVGLKTLTPILFLPDEADMQERIDWAS
jgi:hypothetical protein